MSSFDKVKGATT